MTLATDRRQGINSSIAFKAPCRLATTAAITLSGFQTIDGVLPTSSDTHAMRRILVKNQDSSADNGVYVMTADAWERDKDFDGNQDFVKGTRVYVHSGSTMSGAYTMTAAVGTTFALGTDPVTFESTTQIDLGIGAFTALTTPDPAADFIFTYDTSAALWKKLLPSNLAKYNASGSATAPAIAAEAFLTTGIYWDTGIIGFAIEGVSELQLAATALRPGADGGLALGSTTRGWQSAFFASGAVLNFNNGDITVTHSADVLAFAGGSYTFDGSVNPASDGGSSLGTTTLGWQNIFANTGFVFNIENGNWVATHTSGILTVGTGDLRVTTAGTNAASVVTLDGAQTLGNKTLTAAKIANAGFLADANGNELIIFTTTASAVNEITYANAGTGANPSITASGETNVSISLAGKGTGGIIIGGTSTNDAAAAGKVGEFTSATVLSASSVGLTSGVTADVTSISLTAGDWDVWGSVWFRSTNAGTSITVWQGGINTTSATLPTAPGSGAAYLLRTAAIVPGNDAINGGPVGTVRLSLSATTTVYLVANSTFTVSTNSAYGFIAARRRR